MDAVAHFLAMGGYARFVWPAYGVAVLVLGWMVTDTVTAYRRSRRELQRLEPDRPRR